VEQHGYRVTVTVDEAVLGFRSGEITVESTSGQRIETAEVTLTALMRQHGMLLPPQRLQIINGTYRYEQLEINMEGEWQYQLRINETGTTTLVEVPIVFAPMP
jgi:hypothetical protein